jgi:hypothetical protein
MDKFVRPIAKLKPLIDWLPSALADLLRGVVRCAVPLVMLIVFGMLLFVDQGRDAMLVLVERATPRGAEHSVAGLVFLGFGSAVLSLSLWYSMRWLLTAQMPSLPLDDSPGPLRGWLPRIVGAAVPGLIALDLYLFVVPAGAPDGAQQTATSAAIWFAGLAMALLLFYWSRGGLILLLQGWGWLAETRGREHGKPGAIGVDEPLPAATVRIAGWSATLSVLAALLIILFPLSLPRVVGAAGVAALALASMNLFGSFLLTYLPLRNGLPHLAPWAILFAGLIGGLNDNHLVQPADRGDKLPYQRIDVAADFNAFLDRLGEDGRSPIPVVFVASEGGGIRAAYWTAVVLEALRERVPELERHLYALSGVSGGSVGLAGWLVSRRAELCGIAEGDAGPSVARSLGMDFVAPAIATLLYPDMIQRYLPWPIQSFDRSRALEEGWQRAFAHAPDRPFEGTLSALYEGCERLPHLMLNSTVVETGQRAVLTLLATNPHGADPVLIDHFDAMDEKYTAWKQSLAGLAHHSARFPVVSPAGTVEETGKDGKRTSAFRLVDGGYFDNSGIQTALELIGYLQQEAQRGFTPLLILVRNDPDRTRRCKGPCTPGTGVLFPEVASVIGGLYNARGAHAESSLQSIDRVLEPPKVFDLVVGEQTPAARAPLGWSLSDSVRKTLDQEADVVAANYAKGLNTMLDPAEEETSR